MRRHHFSFQVVVGRVPPQPADVLRISTLFTSRYAMDVIPFDDSTLIRCGGSPYYLWMMHAHRNLNEPKLKVKPPPN